MSPSTSEGASDRIVDKCGAPYDPNALFCSKCGKRLRKINYCPSCGKKRSVKSPDCMHCGFRFDLLRNTRQIVRSQLKYCPVCGTVLSADSTCMNQTCRIGIKPFATVIPDVRYDATQDEKPTNVSIFSGLVSDDDQEDDKLSTIRLDTKSAPDTPQPEFEPQGSQEGDNSDKDKGEKPMGMFDPLNPIQESNRDPKLESLIAYENHFAELLRAYAPEIEKMEQMLRDLREEQRKFYLEDLVSIQETLRNDEILSERAKEQWILELRANMEKSFQISEELISHFITNNKAEFRKKMEEALKKV